MKKSFCVVLCLAAVLGAIATGAHAQPAAQTGKLLITVVDPSRLVIPGATVTVAGLDDANKKTLIAPIKSSDKGVAAFEGLPPGRYTVHGEFPGFGIGAIKELRLKAGENKHVLVLPLATMTEEITVERDKQTSASDRGATFGSALTREQIDALSEDPDEMARQLQDMAGPGATMRVDSFEGSQLPPKSMIKAIHITRDSFAAENHSAGGMFIDIITQPGMRPLGGGVRYSFYDSAFDGSNPLVPKKGPAQSHNYSVNFGGALAKERSSFNVSINGLNSFRTPNIYATVPSGLIAQNINLRVPTDNLGGNAFLDYALTKDQTLRVGFGRNTMTTRNQGVGTYDLPGRAYDSDNTTTMLRIQEAGPLGRRFFINTRFMLNWTESSASSALEAPTIFVQDAFNSGGAQRKGGRSTKNYSLQSDLDYVKGIQSWRAGISIEGGTYRSDDASNYLGTYTFSSLAQYEAGLPLTYTRRVGDPLIDYANWLAAFYIQDDIRVSKSLTLSPGVRIEAQTHVKDNNNIGPRFGVTWAPFKSGKTTLRASVGRFYDWLSSGTYEQTLRVDGVKQQEINIPNPSYPDPGSGGTVIPTNKYMLDPDMQLAWNTRLSLGIDQQISKVVRFNVLYSDTKTDGVLVGQNLNAPVNGVRPNPNLANQIEAVADGSSRTRRLSTSVSLNFAPMTFTPATTGATFAWRRGLNVNVGYGLGKSESNTNGAFSIPASNSLATEWGPSNFDVRHTLNVSLMSTALKNFTAMIFFYTSSATPYTMLTGIDTNGDGLLNDRPAGVGRNTLRGSGSWNSNGMFSYTFNFGSKTVPGGMGIMATSSGGNVSVTQMAMGDMSRYRLTFSANVSNLMNHANYAGYSGLMTSPFFMKPTVVDGVRSANFSVAFSF